MSETALGGTELPGAMVAASDRPDPLLSIVGLSARFGGVTALSEVSLSANEAEIVGVIGPNGAGKTTLFNCICGICQPTSGEIRYAGERIDAWAQYARARAGIRRTFQNLALFEGMTVVDNVRAGADHPAVGRTGAWSTNVVEELIELTGLSDYRDAPIPTLSFGYRKRVEIARALAGSPRLLLLDEPAAGILPSDADAILTLVMKLRDTRRVTVLLVEHEMPIIATVADRVVAMDFGRVIAEGVPDTILKDQAVVDAYLGGPS